jgi:hypothetical protein
MSVLHTREQFIAHLGLDPASATPSDVVAEIRVDPDEAAIEAAIDARFFPELRATATPTTEAVSASRETPVDDALAGQLSTRTLPSY